MCRSIDRPTVEAMIVDHARAGATTRGGSRYPSGGWVLDVVAALLATAFMLLATSHIASTGSDRELDAVGYLLICLAGGSLVLCRRRPDVVVGVVAIVLATYLLRHYVGGPIFVTAWVGLFFLSWRSNRRTAVIGAVALASVLVLAGLAAGSDALVLHLVFIGWSAAAVLLGEALRNRRSYLAGLRGTRSLPRAHPGGGGPAPGRRGAAAHRPRPARQRRARDGHHQRAGRRGGARAWTGGRRPPRRRCTVDPAGQRRGARRAGGHADALLRDDTRAGRRGRRRRARRGPPPAGRVDRPRPGSPSS